MAGGGGLASPRALTPPLSPPLEVMTMPETSLFSLRKACSLARISSKRIVSLALRLLYSTEAA
jgi:hypothetical protein